MDFITTVSESDEDEKSKLQDVDQEKGETYLKKTWGARPGGNRKVGNAKISRKNAFVLGANDARLESSFRFRLESTRSVVESLKRVVVKHAPNSQPLTEGVSHLDTYVNRAVSFANQGAWSEALRWLNNADNFAESNQWDPVRDRRETDDFVRKAKECTEMLNRLQSEKLDQDTLIKLHQQIREALTLFQEGTKGKNPQQINEAKETLDLAYSVAGKLKDQAIQGARFETEVNQFFNDVAPLKGDRRYGIDYNTLNIRAFQASQKAKNGDPGGALAELRELANELKAILKEIGPGEKPVKDDVEPRYNCEKWHDAILDLANELAAFGEDNPLVDQLKKAAETASDHMAQKQWVPAEKILKPLFDQHKSELDRLKAQAAIYSRKVMQVNELHEYLKKSLGDDKTPEQSVQKCLIVADQQQKVGKYDIAIPLLEKALSQYGPLLTKAKMQATFEENLKTATSVDGLPLEDPRKEAAFGPASSRSLQQPEAGRPSARKNAAGDPQADQPDPGLRRQGG